MQIAHICTCRDERSASLEATNAGAPEKILTFFDWLSEKTSNQVIKVFNQKYGRRIITCKLSAA